MIVIEEEHRAQIVDEAETIVERNVLLNVGQDRSLILCTPLDEPRVRRLVESVDCHWSVGESVPCTRGAVHRHWALIRK